MNPSRPYRCIKDVIVDPQNDYDTAKMYSMECTINLFDVDNFFEVINELEGFKDDHKRTLVYLPEGRHVIIRVSYKDFNAMMMQIKRDYQLLDDRSMTPSDKVAYKGFMKATCAIKKQFMVVTFHRKNYELKGCSEKDFEDFGYHSLFNYVYPMN